MKMRWSSSLLLLGAKKMHLKRKTCTSHQRHTNLPLNVNFVLELTITKGYRCHCYSLLSTYTYTNALSQAIKSSSRPRFKENAWYAVMCEPTLSENFLRNVEMRVSLPRSFRYVQTLDANSRQNKPHTDTHARSSEKRKTRVQLDFLRLCTQNTISFSFESIITITSFATQQTKTFSKQNEKRKTNKILERFFFSLSLLTFFRSERNTLKRWTFLSACVLC